MKWNIYFDPTFPTTGQIKSRFGDEFKDLNEYDGLKDEDLVDVVLSLKRGQGLIIPRKYQFWDKTTFYRSRGDEIKLDSAIRFNKFGPEMNLNKRNMTIKEVNETYFLPIPAMREKTKEMGVNEAYRGFGYWGIRSKKHRLIPFDVLVEGWLFYEKYGNSIGIKYQHGDTYCSVSSLTRKDRRYEIVLRPTPTTEPNVLWTETHGDTSSEDAVFREMRSKYKSKDIDKFLDRFKYSMDEFTWSRSTYGCYEKSLKESQSLGKSPIVVQMFPKPTGIFNPWFILKNYTIIADKDGKNARKPTKTENRITLGRVIAYDSERMFDFDSAYTPFDFSIDFPPPDLREL